MMDVASKIKALFQWGRQSTKNDDSGQTQTGQIETIGSKPFPFIAVYPYGFSANAPVNSRVLSMNINGSGKGKAGLPTMPENRFRDLKECEVKVGNFKTKAHIFFAEDGDIKINTSSSDSEDWAVRSSALETAFNTLKAEHDALSTIVKSIQLTVTNVVPTDPTKPVIAAWAAPPPLLPSVANIALSKVEKVRLP